jgi:hypothetical protein
LTEPVMDFSDVPDGADESTPRRRGRPRSPETIDRDERVFTQLRDGGPQSKEQLVEALGSVKPTHVYLSLWRLAKEKRVERASDGTSRHTWQVVA